jgi:DNA-directed RNA polymerase subunit RPC12/RpoP
MILEQIPNVPFVGFVIGDAAVPSLERFALEDLLLDRGFVLACRSHLSGDYLCGDCASNEDHLKGGVQHDLIALSTEHEDEDGPWRCDHCGSRDFD